VIEKVLEGWLDSATERSFQIPFAHLLSNQGYRVLHITHHCGLEMGKDIIAVDSNGIPCAFQLKTAENGKFSLQTWRRINNQIRDLVYLKINHPSIGNYNQSHRSILVTNGFIKEDATRAINDFNATLLTDRKRPLETIVKGDILKLAKETYPLVFPSELRDFKSLLEFFLEDGTSYLPKGKLANLLESLLYLNDLNSKFSNKELGRKIASAALITSISLTQFSKELNWIAEIEGWTIYLAYLCAVAQRWKLKEKLWKSQFELAETAIFNSMTNLLEELKGRTNLIEGEPLSDALFYRVRVTYLVALMSILGIWQKFNSDNVDCEFISDFVLKYRTKMLLWGEGAIPQILAFYWYYRKIDATSKPDFLLAELIEDITTSNNPKSKIESLAPPYYQTQEIILHKLGIKKFEDIFKGRSFFLKGLIYLFTRKNWKQKMKILWPNATYIMFEEFIPKENWQFYLWRTSNGVHKAEIPRRTENWKDLKKRAFQIEDDILPQLLVNYPHLLLLFICVYPHRVNPSILKCLDDKLMNT